MVDVVDKYRDVLNVERVLENAGIVIDGKKRAALLLDGDLSAEEFRKLQLDKTFKPRMLEEMRALEPEVFAEVFDKKITTSGGESGIFNIMSDQIESKRDGVGVPSDIYKHDRPLDDRQQKLLDRLPEYNSRVTVDKSEVSMTDLSALTAKEGVEFAMFTCGSRRVVIRGDVGTVPLPEDDLRKMVDAGYKWSGHTHPGGDKNVLRPSPNDEIILSAFNQKTGVIYNSVGEYQTFANRDIGGNYE